MGGTFRIDNPQGISPSSPIRRGANARVAHDSNFRNQTLAPFADDKLISTECRGSTSIIVEDCCVQCADGCDGEIVRVELPCVSYYKMEGGKLYASCEPCSDDWCEICVPCDLCAPVVNLLEDRQTDGCIHMRSYAYSLVDKFGNTTPMSRPSEPVPMDWDVDALVSGFDVNHPGCWESVCIWATQPDDSEPTSMVTDSVSYFKVATVSITDGIYVHDPEAAPPIEGYNVEKQQRIDKPPPGLHCIQVINRGKQLAGLDENGQLHFSLPRNLGAFSEDFMMRFRKPGVAFAATDAYGYVLTAGKPQVIDLTLDCENGRCHQTTRVEYHLPVISKRSVATWADGVVYASDEGLVYLRGATPTLLTGGDYTRDDWLALQPTLMMGVVHDGYYIGVTPTETIRVRLPGALLGAGEGSQITTMSIRPTAAYTSCDGRLFYADEEGVKEFAGGDGKRPYKWQIGPIESPRDCAMGGLRLRMNCCEDVKVRFLVGDCDKREVFCRTVVGDRPIRLPKWIQADQLYIELEGVAEISGITLGSDYQLLGV